MIKKILLFLVFISVFINLNAEEKKGQNSVLNEKEIQWVKENPEITLGFFKNLEPAVIKNKNGELSGFLIDFKIRLEQLLNLKINIDIDDYENLNSKLQNGEIDGILAASNENIIIDNALKSIPHFKYYFAAFENSFNPQNISSNLDIKDKKVAVMESFIKTNSAVANNIDMKNAILVDSPKEAFLLLMEEKVDLAMLLSFQNYHFAKYNFTGIKISHIDWANKEQAVTYIHKDQEVLLNIINKGIMNISDFELSKINNKWAIPKINANYINSNIFNSTEKNKYNNSNFFYELLFTILSFIISFILLIIYWNKKISIEIRKRRISEQALKKSKKKYRQIIEGISDDFLFYSLDSNGIIKYISASCINVFGYKASELLGKKWSDIFFIENPHIQSKREFTIYSFDNISNSFEARIMHKNGSEKLLEINEKNSFDKKSLSLSIEGVAVDVTERKKIEYDLTKLSQAITQSSSNVIITDKKGVIEYVNSQVIQSEGYLEEQLVGKHISILAPIGKFDTIYQNFQRVIAIHDIWKGEIQNQNKKGLKYWVALSISTIKNKNDEITNYSFIYQNISELKKLTSELEEAKKTLEVSNQELLIYKKFAQSSSQGFRMANLNGTISYMNPSLIDLSGVAIYDDDNLSSLLKFYTPNSQKILANKVLPRIATGKNWSGELEYYLSDHNIINTLEYYYPIADDNSNTIKIATIINDITELKKAEKALKLAQKEAESANESKSMFLANMSHEIRTPMNAIIGLSTLMKKTNLDKTQKDFLEKIEKSSNSLLGIINDILDFSKIEAGKINIEKINFNLSEIIMSIVEMLNHKIYEKDLQLNVKFDKAILENLIGDPLRIRQVILNFLNNSIKFTEKGSIIIKTELVDENNVSQKIKVSIIDTGIGMNDDVKNKLFRSFSQADESTTRKYGGTGLGLSISKNLIELMDGDIGVESELNKGSEFFFELNLNKANSTTKKENIIQKEFKDINIAIVDDSETELELLTRYFDDMQLNYKAYNSAQLASTEIPQFQNSPETAFDIIIVDWKMNEINGLDLIKQIDNENQYANNATKVLITSYDVEELKNSNPDINIDYYLKKPITQSTLFNLILNLLEKNKNIIAKDDIFKKMQHKELELIRGANILLAEDNELNQIIVKEFLEAEEFNIIIANNGREVLDILEERSDIELILMDLHMPILNGYETTEKVRNQKVYSDIPIVALTADAIEGVHENVLQGNMNDYITKPIDYMILINTLIKWLKPNQKSLTNSKITEKINDKSKDDFPILYGIDTDDALARIWNNIELFTKLLTKYYWNNRDTIENIMEYIATSQNQSALEALHAFKGVTANIGGKKLYSLIEETEKMIKTEHPITVIIKQIKKIQFEFDLISESIHNNLIKCDIRLETTSLNTNSEHLQDILINFENTLEESDIKSREYFELICSNLKDKKYTRTLNKIDSFLNLYNFDASLEEFGKLKNMISGKYK